MKLTKQGVRDLDELGPKKFKNKRPVALCMKGMRPHELDQDGICTMCGTKPMENLAFGSVDD